jgi:ElaB/YqjD/DUF883 family membrane-anchored ribosome-binding protein
LEVRVAKRTQGNRLDSAATAIGGALGRVAAKVQRLERQRDAVAAELRQVIDTAQDMLDKLGDYAIVARRRARRAVRRVTRRRRRRLSARGRANIIAAAKKRWALVRKAKAAKG